MQSLLVWFADSWLSGERSGSWRGNSATKRFGLLNVIIGIWIGLLMLTAPVWSKQQRVLTWRTGTILVWSMSWVRNLESHEMVNTLCMLLSFLQNLHSHREQFCSACRWRPPQIRRLQSNLQWWIRRRSPGVHFLRFQLLSHLVWYQLSQFTSTRYWSAGIEVICWLNCATHWSESYIFHLSFLKISTHWWLEILDVTSSRRHHICQIDWPSTSGWGRGSGSGEGPGGGGSGGRGRGPGEGRSGTTQINTQKKNENKKTLQKDTPKNRDRKEGEKEEKRAQRCVGCDIVQADHAPDGGVAQGVVHGDVIRHHGRNQEEVEEGLEKEEEGQKEENAQTTICTCMDGMKWKDAARPLSQCDSVNRSDDTSTNGAQCAQCCAVISSVWVMSFTQLVTVVSM